MKYRILNYPQTIEGCHDLIKILVAELNEYAEFVLNDYEGVSEDRKDSSPSTHDNKFPQPFVAPAGINGGTQRDGGVDFMNFRGDGVPSTTRKNV